MATVALSGTASGGAAISAAIILSYEPSNLPDPGLSDLVDTYNDPSAPTSSRVGPGPAHVASAGQTFTPFLRTSLDIHGVANSNYSLITLTQPSGTRQGDLMIAVVVNGQASTLSGWTTLYRNNGSNPILAHNSVGVFYRYAQATDANTTWAQNANTDSFAQLRVYGNASGVQIASANTTRSTTGAGNVMSTSAATLPANHLAAFFFTGYGQNTIYALNSWSTDLTAAAGLHAVAGNNYFVMASGEVQTAVQTTFPQRNFTVTGASTSANGNAVFLNSVNFVLDVLPAVLYPYADVSLEEAVGPTQDSVDVEWVHLLMDDQHSGQSDYGYAENPLHGTGTLHTCERWFRLRFAPGYGTARAFRFWLLESSAPPGWTLRYGTTPSYAAPTSVPSSVATNPLPTSDPGRAAPNVNASAQLIGTETQYTDWIVMQATVDTDLANHGPVIGFSAEGALIPIELRFAWTET